MNEILNVFRTDHKRIFRDPFLLFMALAPFIFGLVIHFLLPYFNVRFQDVFNLSKFYPLIICLFSITPALYLGAILALQIVEEKEENLLTAIAVTPFSLTRYFMIRIASYTLISFIVIGLVQLEIGILHIQPHAVWLVALCAAFQVPIMAFIVASYASNQLEGMVALKGTGFLILPSLAMFFVPEHWHLLCGVLPSYWPIMAFFKAAQGSPDAQFYIYICIGIIYQCLIIVGLYRYFEKNALR